jgi:hypothetical protein
MDWCPFDDIHCNALKWIGFDKIHESIERYEGYKLNGLESRNWDYDIKYLKEELERRLKKSKGEDK